MARREFWTRGCARYHLSGSGLEDDDLCVRARLAGYRCMNAQDVLRLPLPEQDNLPATIWTARGS
jgi:hypothetical protein